MLPRRHFLGLAILGLIGLGTSCAEVEHPTFVSLVIVNKTRGALFSIRLGTTGGTQSWDKPVAIGEWATFESVPVGNVHIEGWGKIPEEYAEIKAQQTVKLGSSDQIIELVPLN